MKIFVLILAFALGWLLGAIFVSKVEPTCIAPQVQAHVLEAPDGSKQVWMDWETAEKLRKFFVCMEKKNVDG